MDITDMKRTEQALAEQLSFEHLLSELSSDFINLPTGAEILRDFVCPVCASRWRIQVPPHTLAGSPGQHEMMTLALSHGSEIAAALRNAGPAIITATLNFAPLVTATVDYATIAGGTATAGSDYTTVGPNTLTFAPGVSSMTFAVPIANDLIGNVDTAA